MYEQFAVFELPGILTYRLSVTVRNAASPGRGIGVTQFGDNLTSFCLSKSKATTVSPSVLSRCELKNISRSDPSNRNCRSLPTGTCRGSKDGNPGSLPISVSCPDLESRNHMTQSSGSF